LDRVGRLICHFNNIKPEFAAMAANSLQGVFMAYVDSTEDPRFPNFYNVNFPVGKDSPNKRDDVFLVQWLLHRVYSDSQYFTSPDGGDIAMDGWIGPKTNRWIIAFQTDVRNLGEACVVDGRVDRARVGGVASITKTYYTIVWLNAFLLDANPAVYNNPSADPECPQELLSALANNSGGAGPYMPQAIPSGGI
jgi:hypothetical protein